MGGAQGFFQPQQIDGWCRRGGGVAPVLPLDFAAECLVLQVKKAGGALNVGQGFGAGGLQPLEYFAAGKRPFELADELFEVCFDNPVEIDQLAIDVVNDLNF